MSVKLKLAKIPAVGQPIEKKWISSHERALESSPFRYYPGTSNRPIPLVCYDDCITMQDTEGNVIGYMSLDTVDDDINNLDLWCAQIATLHDETYQGADPLSRVRYAWSVDQIAAITTMGLGQEYVETKDTHILSYCLIVSRQNNDLNEDTYRRHGIAEVECEWLDQAPLKTITLV